MEKNKVVQQEEKILQFWQKQEIFKKSLAQESPKGEYVFYDGPPFATGTPHYGHIVASLMKDAVPRFWTMNGYHVERKWGWDCHGLPIENIVEKEKNIKSKKEIEEEMGVEKFNAACRSKVMMYADEWKKFIPRIGRWVDMDNPYSTMDVDFMESVWWVFKQLWDKKLIYEGHKSMHICPRCETTLSQSEVSQGYKEVKDISVIAKFKLYDEEDTYVLAWTTTPWTLPGNLALAVGENIRYIKVQIEGSNYILAKDAVEKILADKKFEVIDEFDGQKLVGKSYHALFPYFDNSKNRKKGFKIYPADFVVTEEGTGVVHIAAGFGEDDLNLAKKYELPWIQHVDINGRFIKEVIDFPGLPVKPIEDPQGTDIKILKYLAEKKLLFHKEKYSHSYPHCWRCDSPLLNYSTSSWFVSVDKIKNRLLQLAKEISWIPDHIKEGRFGKWLEGAQDWSISRQRFWGSIIPIWKCDHCHELRVFGSIHELTDSSGAKVTDLHKDKMDAIKFKCHNCPGTMQRIPDVLDCWFESGSMPYAQMHYPFANKEKFEKNFPAEFIAEGVDQTRCWFYYLLVLAVGVSDKIPYENVIANGIVLAEDGQKMSKKLKNYPNPTEIIDKYGADALRYYLLTSPVMKADTLLFSEKGVDEVYKKLIMILENTFTFYQMFASTGVAANDQSTNILDRWILIKQQKLLQDVDRQMRVYDLMQATRPIIEFVNELSTWYLRRSRARFKSENSIEKNQALSTMKYVLINLVKILAPFTPFIAEKIYLEIDHTKESVHLEKWPSLTNNKIDAQIITDMQKVREAVEKGLALRDEAKIKIRQPLISMQIPDLKLSEESLDLIKAEVNIKNIILGKDYSLNTELSTELKQEGILREIIRAINALRKKKGLTIHDNIKVVYSCENQDVKLAITTYQDEIRKNTLSLSWTEGSGTDEIKINNEKILVSLV